MIAFKAAASVGLPIEVVVIIRLRHFSRAHHAVRHFRRFPGRLANGAELAAFAAGARSPQLGNWICEAVRHFVSALEFPFPGNGDGRRQRPVRQKRLSRGEAKHLVLAEPFGWQVAKTD
jgi:hypothetical protein